MQENEFLAAVNAALFDEATEDETVVERAEDVRDYLVAINDGYVVVGDPGDAILAFIRGGILVGCAYASYRGVFQAGAFDGRQAYARTNARGIAQARNVPFDEWYMVGDEQDVCASIAADTYRRIVAD